MFQMVLVEFVPHSVEKKLLQWQKMLATREKKILKELWEEDKYWKTRIFHFPHCSYRASLSGALKQRIFQ